VREGSSNGAGNIGLFKKYYKIKKKMLLHYKTSLPKYSTQKLKIY
tara:strand:- start:1785 stop:1919 length:135 start_codon:yes stop_codon:yes gene_type:complete